MSEDRIDDAKAAARKAREERLGAALRANLRRRKAASRVPPAPESSAELSSAPPPVAAKERK